MKTAKGCLTAIGAVVVLIVIIAVIAAAGSKSNSGPTKSPALVTGSGNTGASAAPKVAAHTQTFKGNGSENIGTINAPVDSTLKWSCASCSGDNFLVESDANSDLDDISLDALGPTHGQTVVDKGTYSNVQVITEGQGWTIRLVPGT